MTLAGPMRIKSPFFLDYYYALLRTMIPGKALRGFSSPGMNRNRKENSICVILFQASKGWIKVVMDPMKEVHVCPEITLVRV